MKSKWTRGTLMAVAFVTGTAIAVGVFVGVATRTHSSAAKAPARTARTGMQRATRRASTHQTASTAPAPRREQTTTLTGQVPLALSNGEATLVRPHPKDAEIVLNFGFPIQNQAGLDALIAQQARTHQHLTREQLYARFSPTQQQYGALRTWLVARGFTVTHVGADRLALSASAPTAVVEKTLHVSVNDYIRKPFTFHGIKVQPFQFYANTTAPVVPKRFGLQAISGLSDIDRFFTSYELDGGGRLDTEVRSGGYFPVDLRGLYDITGHGASATGQTIGFTLWTAPEKQAAMTQFATTTGDQLITVDPSCTPTPAPNACVTQTVQPDHLLHILENGNSDTNANFGSNVETALDIQAAHAVAPGVAMKYYASECNATTPPGSGLTNAGCNGSDLGLENAIQDAAADPTLHSVSNSWGFGGEAEWGEADPFLLTANASMALAAAAGTTFYFSTGDSGTYFSGYPSDSPYVVGVGGTSLYSTTDPGAFSTLTTWSGAGSWCSNSVARPAWQSGPGITANAGCSGRVVPDVSAVADPNTGVRFTRSTNLTGGTQSGQVGGTSLAAPVLNGLQAMTQNFIAAQSYPGAKPQIGFTAPLYYALGNSPSYSSYYRDVVCGNTANPTSGPDGDPALKGWDAATGWGDPDWFNWSTGVAQQLGATGLTTPASLSPNFMWTCAKTPSNSSERAFSCPTASTCYAVGAASGATPWYGKFLPSGAWGAVNTFFKSSDGGATWFPSNSDMLSIACTSSATCMTVGAGGRERRTTDGGDTWNDVATGSTKPLTHIACPSSSICYAAGDRGFVYKSADGGQTWSELHSTGSNPLYGLSCPTTQVCYATDIYAHILKTADGGSTWAWQATPITTPGVQVPGSGGPNPFAGLMAISCSDASTCVASGLYVVPSGQTIPSTDPPIVTTTDGGAHWVRQTSNAGANNYLHGVSCLPGTTTCWAVGRGGRIVTTTDLATWTPQTSNTTNMLNSVLCLSTSFCIAVGQSGTVDVYNGTTWTATTGNGGTGMLADVDCDGNLVCYATGKQGITLLTTTGGTAWTIKAGGGTTQQMNGIACTSASTCTAVGNAGTILATSNGGQSWLPQTSGVTANLNAVSCPAANTCSAVGAVVSGAATARYTTDGSTWNAGAGTPASALNGISCYSATGCVAVGAGGVVSISATGGATWTPAPSGTTAALNAVTCPAAGACYAVGAAAGAPAAGTIIKSADGGTTWGPQPSSTTQTLNGVACFDATTCFADGNGGAVVATGDGGATWAQQGNPLSGPTTALNATSIAINGATCSRARCLMGTGAQGDILTSPLVVVTVHTSSPYGTTPGISGLAGTDPSLTISPAAEAAHLTGTLSCSTTATSSSAPGTYPVSACSGLADVGFNVVYDYAGSSHTVVKASQTISFAPLVDATFGDPDFTVSATATSGLPVSFAAAGNCTVSGTTVHISGAGSCTITASQAGDANYEPAPDVPRTFTIAKADQTITFTGPPDQTFGNADFEITATASSGLPVSLGATGPCTLDSALSPAHVHITGAGSCVITASQAGNANWKPAPDVVRSFAIGKAGQTITFGPLGNKTFGDPDFGVSATASSGLTVSFAASGQCTVTGSTVHIVHGGSCTITASQPGDDNWNPAPDVPQSFTIARQQTTTTYTGVTAPVLNGQTASLSGLLKGSSGQPLAGKQLTLTFGSQSCIATTDASGTAACGVVVNQSPGTKATSASFAGDTDYLPSSGTGSSSVFTARSLIQGVDAQANSLLATVDKKDQGKLKDIVKQLDDCLDSNLWVDGNHITDKKGEQVFDNCKQAAHQLNDLLKKSSIPDATLQGMIDDLVNAARILAQTAINDVQSGDAKKLAQAQNEMAQAEAELAKGHLDPAFDHFKNAWSKAGDAAKKPGPGAAAQAASWAPGLF
jgi:photosystem II stability/assembly factor-like uncharacterized protein